MCAESGVPGVTTSGVALFAFACIVAARSFISDLGLGWSTGLPSVALAVAVGVQTQTQSQSLSQSARCSCPKGLIVDKPAYFTAAVQACVTGASPTSSAASSFRLSTLASAVANVDDVSPTRRRGKPGTNLSTHRGVGYAQNKNVVNVIAAQWEMPRGKKAAIK